MEKLLTIRYIAFLRGINVGGHSMMKMETLRTAFESLGFRNVKTVLASGNVLFEAPDVDMAVLSHVITEKLQEIFGREILAIVRPVRELRELEARQPFKGIEATPGIQLNVTFLSDSTKGGGIAGLSMREGFKIMSNADGIICSVIFEKSGADTIQLMSAIEKEYGPRVTTRTWNTIARILKASEVGQAESQ